MGSITDVEVEVAEILRNLPNLIQRFNSNRRRRTRCCRLLWTVKKRRSAIASTVRAKFDRVRSSSSCCAPASPSQMETDVVSKSKATALSPASPLCFDVSGGEEAFVDTGVNMVSSSPCLDSGWTAADPKLKSHLPHPPFPLHPQLKSQNPHLPLFPTHLPPPNAHHSLRQLLHRRVLLGKNRGSGAWLNQLFRLILCRKESTSRVVKVVLIATRLGLMEAVIIPIILSLMPLMLTTVTGRRPRAVEELVGSMVLPFSSIPIQALNNADLG